MSNPHNSQNGAGHPSRMASPYGYRPDGYEMYSPGPEDHFSGMPYTPNGSWMGTTSAAFPDYNNGGDIGGDLPAPHYSGEESYGFFQPQSMPWPMSTLRPAEPWYPPAPASNRSVETAFSSAGSTAVSTAPSTTPSSPVQATSYAMQLFLEHDTLTPHVTTHSAVTPTKPARAQPMAIKPKTSRPRGPVGTPYLTQEPARIEIDGVVINEDVIDDYWNRTVKTVTERQHESQANGGGLATQYYGQPTARESELQRLKALNSKITTQQVMDAMFPNLWFSARPSNVPLLPVEKLRFRLMPFVNLLTPTQLVAFAVVFEILKDKVTNRDADHDFELAYFAFKRMAPELIRYLPDICGRCAERGFRGCWYIYPYSSTQCIQCGVKNKCSHAATIESKGARSVLDIVPDQQVFP